ncbi:MAG: hypothetical protein Q8922_09715, partial [Bacteroidota bacterium]|nr:hypothetical protein [Bacteroidota bacterium]MDP4232831.1 hypothetical protein [Bacteroidota bacterium]MDP4241875.1 hypothetical protein [Bacteroidota bacterium]MDP4288200.1 hypothetical protein [Bacteroidota bacterium]
EPFVTTQAGSVVQHVASLGIHIAPVPTDSVLATLHFSAFLSQYQQTRLSVDGITFSAQPARPSDCIALAQMDTSAFTLRTLCGSSEILQELNGLPLTLDAIVPNPSHHEVILYYTLTGMGSLPENITLEDALGRTQLKRWVQLEPGPRMSVTLDLSGVASGMYSIRLGAGLARQVVKE